MKTIRTAIRRLETETLAKELPESLTENELESLLLLADQSATKEIAKIAARLAKAKPAKVAEIAIAHSLKMQSYLYIRALLCGDVVDDDDFGDLAIF